MAKKKKVGMPTTRKPSAIPPRHRPPILQKEIIPHELPTPKITVISEEQKEAFRNSDLTVLKNFQYKIPCKAH